MTWGRMMNAAVTAKERRFDAGPLKIREFVGNPARQNGDAKTMARVMFQYEFTSRRTSKNRVAVRLSSFHAYSVFLPKESWWRPSARAELLDHEQGHFDLVEIAARRVTLVVERMFKKKETPAQPGGKA